MATKRLTRHEKVKSGANATSVCSNCRLRDLCVATGLDRDQLGQLDSLVARTQGVDKNDSLYSRDEQFKALFAIRSGSFKTRLSNPDGREHITGFYLPGELLGMDGVAAEKYTENAVALESSEVCVLLYSDIERISGDFPQLQRQMHKIMSREIVKDHGVLMLLGGLKADERMAAFLLNLSQRYLNLGYSPIEFSLRMTRADLGSYLGLKLETVSRTLSKFQKDGLLEIDGKDVKLLEPDKLRFLVGSAGVG